MKKVIYIALALFIFNSCEKDIDLNLPEYESKLVVDGRIEQGIPPIIFLSKSLAFFGETDLNQSNAVSGAKIYVNNGSITDTLQELCTNNLPAGLDTVVANYLGVDVSILPFINVCAYTTPNTAMFGEVGKTYSLTIENEGRTYTSDTKIPELNHLDSLWYKESTGNPGFGFTWATMTDPDTVANGYRWFVRRTNMGDDGFPKDPRFLIPFGASFFDDFINGETFDFAYERPGSDNDSPGDKNNYFKVGDTIVIKFCTIEKEAVNFLRAAEAQIVNNGSPFASPANPPTNIEGGALGLWVGYGVTYDTTIAQ